MGWVRRGNKGAGRGNAGHISAQTPVIIPVYTYLDFDETVVGLLLVRCYFAYFLTVLGSTPLFQGLNPIY